MIFSPDIMISALSILAGVSVLSYILVLIFKRLALDAGVVDTPRNDRFHAEPVPLLGGNAIYMAFLLGLMIRGMVDIWEALLMFSGVIFQLYGIARHPRRVYLFFVIAAIWCTIGGIIVADGDGADQVLGLLIGGTILLLVGNVDDARGGVIPHVKLVGQLIAGFFLIYFGISVAFFTDIATHWGMPWLIWLAYPFTLFWIIGLTNAFNLIDNMNGLSCGVAVTSSFFFGLISFVNGQFDLGFIFFILAGAGVGYLPHNFPRARIFMGDSGSLFTGFIIAGLSIVGSWGTAAGVPGGGLKLSLAIPMLVLIYPIFDVSLVTITRVIRRRPISLGGKDHSSHRLVRMGLKPTDAVLLIYAFSSFTGFCALFLTMIGYEQAILMLAFNFLFIFLVGLRLARIETDE
ncbi:MAG: undecaprenyl/decaprenyl-phosphate alpha-N-acetylglucosaminyl 1-phosphate transferase [Candidatus Glassbacteria bacterium]|nr:undecaprenyl/decaprenyl-phosphate alpha-N-acetylglucosaminyl 1-phosphate transferase [Candidatus Glassbacteria bacterium]